VSGIDHWREVAAADEDSLREAILTGSSTGKPFTPYVPTFDIGHPRRILDFGCGVGRNFPYLATIATQVVGFDLPEMIERARKLHWPPLVQLEAEWASVRKQSFDLVFASLVFQHMEPEALNRYLHDIFEAAPQCYVLTRGRHDFGGATMRYVAERVALPDGALVEHDPDTNTLRRVATISGEEIAHLDDDRHVEVLVSVNQAGRGDLGS
jgi:SAM-dependent methyltransferase